MASIFDKYDKEQGDKLHPKREFRRQRVDQIVSISKEAGRRVYKGTQKVATGAYKGLTAYKTNEKKLFEGGKEVKVKAVKRFASSGSSELHAKGSFEDMKKRFGRFE